MRAVVQRVASACVIVAGETIGEIRQGLLVLLGVRQGDTDDDARWLADKTASLRIFEDEHGKMNLAVSELKEIPSKNPESRTSGETGSTPARLPVSASSLSPSVIREPCVLVVSQFTLIASTRKGARPSFNDAAKPEVAIPLYESFVRHVANATGRRVATGRFGAMMEVRLVNDGPVTLVIDSKLRE